MAVTLRHVPCWQGVSVFSCWRRGLSVLRLTAFPALVCACLTGVAARGAGAAESPMASARRELKKKMERESGFRQALVRADRDLRAVDVALSSLSKYLDPALQGIGRLKSNKLIWQIWRRASVSSADLINEFERIAGRIRDEGKRIHEVRGLVGELEGTADAFLSRPTDDSFTAFAACATKHSKSLASIHADMDGVRGRLATASEKTRMLQGGLRGAQKLVRGNGKAAAIVSGIADSADRVSSHLAVVEKKVTESQDSMAVLAKETAALAKDFPRLQAATQTWVADKEKKRELAAVAGRYKGTIDKLNAEVAALRQERTQLRQQVAQLRAGATRPAPRPQTAQLKSAVSRVRAGPGLSVAGSRAPGIVSASPQAAQLGPRPPGAISAEPTGRARTTDGGKGLVIVMVLGVFLLLVLAAGGLVAVFMLRREPMAPPGSQSASSVGRHGY
jgi:hypothetical protein